jgi:hypothetical protein
MGVFSGPTSGNPRAKPVHSARRPGLEKSKSHIRGRGLWSCWHGLQDHKPTEWWMTLRPGCVRALAVGRRSSVLWKTGIVDCQPRAVTSTIIMLPPLWNQTLAHAPTLSGWVSEIELHLTARGINRPASERFGQLNALVVQARGRYSAALCVFRTIRRRNLIAVYGLAATASKCRECQDDTEAYPHYTGTLWLSERLVKSQAQPSGGVASFVAGLATHHGEGVFDRSYVGSAKQIHVHHQKIELVERHACLVTGR